MAKTKTSLKDEFLKQNDKDTKTVEMVLDMFRRSEQAKAPYVEKWKKFIEAYKGDMYNGATKPEYKADNTSNYIFSTVESIRPIMVAENPKFQVMPRLEKDFNKSYRVQQALDYEWKRTHMNTLVPKTLLPTLQIGTGILGLFWNGKGQGNVEPKLISAFNFFPSPNATTLDDADYVIYATYKNVGELIREYPDKAEELKMQCKRPDKEELTYGQDTSNLSHQSVLVLEVYMQDYEITHQEILNGEGKKEKVSKLKYENGRRIQIAGDVLLNDGDNPYQGSKYPFVLFKNYDLPDSFWGMGEIEQLLKPQKNADELMNQIIDNAKMTANCQWIMDKNSGIAPGTLSNRPGLIIKKNPGTEVRREQPASIPAYVPNTVEMLKRDMEIISGVHDVTRGERPASITSGVAIQTLTQSAQSRIKLKMQYLEDSLARIGSLWVNRMIQFWVLPRQLRVMVSAKDFEQAEQDMMMTGQQFMAKPMVNGQVPIFTNIQGEEIDGDWDIDVVAGSTMPVNKNARLQLLIQLAQTMGEDGMPMIDRQTLLENSELPNVEEILGRFETAKQQQAEQQAQAQQSMLQEQQANIQMSAEAEMQKASQKHEMEMAKAEQELRNEQGRYNAEREERDQDRELEMVKELLKMQSAKDTENAKQEESGTNKKSENINNNENDTSIEQDLQALMQYIQTLPPEQLQALLEQSPELAQIVQLMQG